VTEKNICNYRDITTGETSVELQLSNYNVFGTRSAFRKTSALSFLLNTNVSRNGSFRDANVSALVWDLNTKKKH
jgi:hypothetical protein